MAEHWNEVAGKMSDREVARRFGICSNTVRRYRLNFGIPAYDPRSTEAPIGLLEKLAIESNYQLAKEFNIATSRVEALRTETGIQEPKLQRPRFIPLEVGIWTDSAIAMLGTMPDPELADRLGVSRTPVKKMRKKLGIAAYKEPFPEITAEIAAEFGKVSDSSLAKRLGVSASFIRRARMKLMNS